jgi:hypothetical protein
MATTLPTPIHRVAERSRRSTPSRAMTARRVAVCASGRAVGPLWAVGVMTVNATQQP